MFLKLRRLLATYIDFNLIFFICYIPVPIIEKYISNIIIQIVLSIILFIIYINIFLRKDILLGYESIGKKIMHLKIYDTNNKRITEKKKLIDRVFYSFPTFNIYPLMILFMNKSSGDKKIGTIVK